MNAKDTRSAKSDKGAGSATGTAGATGGTCCCCTADSCCCGKCVSAFAHALRWLADAIEKCCAPAEPLK